MGTSLHNKIYLGRSKVLDSRPVQMMLAAGACASIALVWFVIHTIK
jgi:hypothetical protein